MGQAGLFQLLTVLDNGSQYLLGTAFSVCANESDFSQISTGNKYVLLTAYHVIAEPFVKNQQIIARDDHKNDYAVTLLYPHTPPEDYTSWDCDFAALEITAVHNYYDCFIMLEEPRKVDCIVKGAVRHYHTMFASFVGESLGLEMLRESNGKVLTLSLSITQLYDTESSKIIPAHEIVKGISGAPVIVSERYCIGVLGNIEDDSAGSRQYAVPAKTINKLFLSKWKHCGEPTIYPGQFVFNSTLLNTAPAKLAVNQSIPDLEAFSFCNEKAEQSAWNKISNIFYAGYPIDYWLRVFVESTDFQSYPTEVQCSLLYYLARLYFKRGARALAFSTFSKISAYYSKIDPKSAAKMITLVSGRELVESDILTVKDMINGLHTVCNSIEKLNFASEKYKAYETSSLIGRGLTALFGKSEYFSDEDSSNLIFLINEQTTKIDAFPRLLVKQTVVNISLNWYKSLWNIDTLFDPECLHQEIADGFKRSKQLQNSIFCIQCILVYGIYFLKISQIKESTALILLFARLLVNENLSLHHEGIEQLLSLLHKQYLAYYGIVCVAVKFYREKNNQLYDLVRKLSLSTVKLSMFEWNNVLQNIECFLNKFRPNPLYKLNIQILQKNFLSNL